MKNLLREVSGTHKQFASNHGFLIHVHFDFKIGMENGSTSSFAMYNNVIVEIKHSSELTHLILMKIILIASTIPPIIATYFKYYVLGWGDESYPELPFMYGI